MYAVIQTGGKQYRVSPGDIIQIEKLAGEVGSSVNFDQVLLVSQAETDADGKIWIGRPLVANAKVEAEIVGQGRDAKVLVFKMKRRKQYRKTIGHRQEATQVLVTSVGSGSGEAATLSDADKKATLAKFQPHLTPWGGKAVSAPAPKQKKPLLKAADVGDLEEKASPKKKAPAKKAAPKAAKKK